MNFQKIYDLNEINSFINTGKPVLVYFSSNNCGICEVLKPKIQKEVQQNFPKMRLYEVQSQESRDITGFFGVFSAPTILVFFDKKEFKRYNRNMSVALFSEELRRPYSLMCE